MGLSKLFSFPNSRSLEEASNSDTAGMGGGGIQMLTCADII